MQKDQMGSGYLERREIKEVDHQCLQDSARGNRWRTQRNSGMKKIGCFASESWWYSFDTVNIGETSEGYAHVEKWENRPSMAGKSDIGV